MKFIMLVGLVSAFVLPNAGVTVRLGARAGRSTVSRSKPTFQWPKFAPDPPLPRPRDYLSFAKFPILPVVISYLVVDHIYLESKVTVDLWNLRADVIATPGTSTTHFWEVYRDVDSVQFQMDFVAIIGAFIIIMVWAYNVALHATLYDE